MGSIVTVVYFYKDLAVLAGDKDAATDALANAFAIVREPGNLKRPPVT